MDLINVLISYLITNAICAGVIWALYSQNHKHFNGLEFWLAAYFMQFSGLVLVITQNYLPDFVSSMMGSAFFIGGMILLYIGLERFLGIQSSQTHNYILFVLFVVVHAYFLFVHPNISLRSVTLSLTLVLICIQLIWLIFRRADVELRPVIRDIGFVFTAHGMVNLAYAGVNLTAATGRVAFQSNLFNNIVLTVYQMLFILLTFNLFLMVNRRLHMELEKDIIELKQAEDDLKQSEKLYRQMFIEHSAAKLLVDPSNGSIVQANSAAAQFYGYAVEELQAMNIAQINVHSHASIAEVMMQALLRKTNYFVFQHRLASGKIRDVEVHSAPINVGGRELLYSIIHDITERKQAEEALRMSEERYRNFIAQSFEAISRTEFDHPIDITLPMEEQIDRIYENAFLAECNQAMADMYHVPSPEALIGMRLIDAHGGKDDPINRETFRKLISNGYRSFNDETKEYTVDGKPIWFLNNTIGIVENGYLVRLWGTAIEITEQKRMEAALRASESSMRSLIENVRDVFARYDLNLRYQYISPIVQNFLDATPESFIGKTHREAGFPEDKAEFFDVSLRKVIETKKPIDVEFSLQGRDGETIQQTRIYPEFDEKGEVISVVTVTSDITERKRMEEALVRNQQMYQDLVERQGVGVYRIRVQKYFSWGEPEQPHYEYEFVNDEYCRLTGASREEHFADPTLTLKLIHPEDYPSFAKKNEEVDITNEPFVWEGRMIVHGEIRWMHYESRSRNFPDIGEVWTGILMDITERKQADEKLRASEERFRQLITSAPDVVFLVNQEGKIMFANMEATNLLGYAPAEFIGMAVEQFIPPQLRNGHIANRAKYMSDPHTRTMGSQLNLLATRKDGNEIPVDIKLSPVQMEAETYIITFMRDVTERVRAESELRATHETLQTQFYEINSLKGTLQEQAIRDPLTGLHNRRYLDETLAHEVARAKRENYPISIMLIDIDHFKNFNDTYGHSTGDEVLKSLSRLLVESIRQGDIACRYGGEEFLIVMVGAHETDVERRAEKIRHDFHELRISFENQELSATISIGVSYYPRHGTEIQQVIKNADIAMYQAKQNGRNRVYVRGT